MDSKNNTQDVEVNVLENIYCNIQKGLNMGKTLISLQGSSRCFAPGTKVRMSDGTLKNVEDIVVGDRLLAIDGNGFNTVTETHSGFDDMYLVHQKKGIDYVVNSKHILSLKQSKAIQHKVAIPGYKSAEKRRIELLPFDRNKIVDMEVSEFLRQSKNVKKRYTGFKRSEYIELDEKELPIDPYYLGLWLGDGTSLRFNEITNVDSEIIEYLEEFAKTLGTDLCKVNSVTHRIRITETGTHNLALKGKTRELRDSFRRLDLINNKHIPDIYIYNSYENRLKLLAGILDADAENSGKNTLTISQKNKKIIDGILEICRLSGFFTNGYKECKKRMKRKDGSIFEGTYYRIEINHNNFNDLNKYMRVHRKKIVKDCDRNYFNTTLEITPVGKGQYFGFTLDNSPYFLLEDLTVLHNSGKTFNVMIFLIMTALQSEYPIRISVVRRSLPSLKRSVLNDFKEIMIRMRQFEDKRFNKTEGIYTFRNGSVIEFFSTDDEQKVRGSKRDILFCNEANELTETEFKQLRMRTSKYCIIDYNPSFTEEHWIYPIRSDVRTYHFVSTYRDNIFLEQAIIDEIESYRYTNQALWQIYGMGEFAIIEGLVFPKENWDIIPDEEYPDWKGKSVLGLDWGMRNDPSVCEEVLFEGMDIYVREIFREKGLLSKDIASLLTPYRNYNKYCDVDNRLVEELELAGIPLLFMTKKNAMSIETGIKLLNQRKIHITASSTELIKEFKNYVFRKDRYDNWTNVPIDAFNHGIDACFVGNTMVLTDNGSKRIDKMCAGDMVVTSKGLNKVLHAFPTGIKKVLNYTITTEKGYVISVECTPNHKFKINNTWKRIENVCQGDRIFLCKSLMEKNTICTQENDTIQEEIEDSTEICGYSTTEQYQKGIMSTIRMKTQEIIQLKILNFFRSIYTYLCMLKHSFQMKGICQSSDKEWIMQEDMLINGIGAKRVLNGTGSKELNLMQKENTQQKNVKCVEKNTEQRVLQIPCSAQIPASQNTEDCQESTMKSESVNTAERNLKSTSTQRESFVLMDAVSSIIKQDERIEYVYDIEVEDAHEFFANGILVHNCRYATLEEFKSSYDSKTGKLYMTKQDLGLFL